MPGRTEWLKLAGRLHEKGKAIFDNAPIEVSEVVGDAEVVALALLARTMGNFQGAILLLENGHLVEARVLVRCCYENLFWLAALTKAPEEFLRAMDLDDAAGRMKRGKALIDWASRRADAPGSNGSLGGLEQFLEDLRTRHADEGKKPGGISFSWAAGTGGVSDGYIVYRELSSDAAHPSATSLSRHATWSQEGDIARFTMHALPVEAPGDIEDTLRLACSSLLGVCVAANEALGGVPGGETLRELADEFGRLGWSD